MVQRSVIEKLSVDNPVKAQEYFAANKERMLPADAMKIESALKPLVKEVEINTAVDEVFSTAPQTATQAELTTAIQKKYKDKPWMKEAQAEIRRLHSDREAAEKEVVDGAVAKVYAAIAKVKMDGKIPKKSDVPPEAWADLARVAPEKVSDIADKIRSGQEHDTDRDRMATDRARAERDRRDTKGTTEQTTTWGLLKLNPSALASVKLDELLATGAINKSQYQDLVTDRLAVQQGKGDHEAKILSDKSAVDTVLAGVKITEKKDPEKYMKFYGALQDRMKVFTLEHDGAKPKQADVLALSRGLLAEVSQDRDFWPLDKSARVFDVNPEKVVVPRADRNAIERALKANGKPITDATVKATYLERKARGAK
jgi:ribosomal protein L22